MSEIITYIESLENTHCTGPVSHGLVVKSEDILGIQFSDDYKLLVKQFGNLMDKHREILGLSSNHIGDCVSYTLEARDEDDTIPTNVYVISCAGIDGILYLQGPEGSIYRHSPFGECVKIANSLEDFIKSF